MTRKIYFWKLRERELQLGERTLAMGVLNVTPDSFSDGGRFNDPDRAYARALELEEQGADIIDIGAESTRPGSERISADEEWRRLGPVLKRLSGNLRVPLSLDTYKSEIAERAIQYGVEIFNDPTGLTFDPNLAKVAANANAGLILNHMRGLPETWSRLPPMQDTVGTIAREMEAMVNRARHSGVERARIVIDPGLGFGKRKEQNAEILAHLAELAALDYPILVGPSRKSFLAQASEDETLFATAAAVAAAVLAGAHLVRVHDVREMRVVIQVAEEIARAAVVRPEYGAAGRPAPRPPRKAPGVEGERPLPTRPPLAKPPEESRTHEEKRDGSAPPVRREFRPAAGKPPFEREFKPKFERKFKPKFERGFEGKDDRRGGRPPRSDARPPRPDARPPRSDTRPPRSGARPPRPDSREDRFRRFDRRGDRTENRPPGKGAPRGFEERSGGRPPKRPFRKRP